MDILGISAEQLFGHRKPSDKTLPKTGEKEHSADGSWSQQRRLEVHWEEQRTLLAEQRVEKLGNLVSGEWNPEKGLVELEKELGKFWAYMGFVDQKRKWLYPEEALFLMETSVLEVWYGGAPISIQQGYSGLLGRELSYPEYQVYAHLRRLGFVVLRHSGRVGPTRYERKIRLDQHTDRKRKSMGTQQRASKQMKVDGERSASPGSDAQDLETGGGTTCTCTSDRTTDGADTVADAITEAVQDVGNDVPSASYSSSLDVTEGKNMVRAKERQTDDSDKKSLTSEMPFHEEHDLMEVQSQNQLCGVESQNTCNQDYWKFDKRVTYSSTKTRFVDFSDISVSNVFGKEEIVLPQPSSELLPPDVCFPKDNYKLSTKTFPLNVAKVKERKPKVKQLNREMDPSLEFSFQEFMTDNACIKISARNWREFKSKKREINREMSRQENTPASVLWQGEVTPLVSGKDANCTASILQKLSVIRELDYKKLANKSSVKPEPVKIVFDVYQPDSKFKKSTPGAPHFRIYIHDLHSDPPSLSSILEAANRLHDDVTLLCAVIDCGDVALYNFIPVSLPFDINMG